MKLFIKHRKIETADRFLGLEREQAAGAGGLLHNFMQN